MSAEELLLQIYMTGSRRKISPEAARVNAEALGTVQGGHPILVWSCELNARGRELMRQFKPLVRGRIACDWYDFGRINGGEQIRPSVKAEEHGISVQSPQPHQHNILLDAATARAARFPDQSLAAM